MDAKAAAITGGLVAGIATSLVMFAGRRSGLMTRTLDRDGVDWIDRTTGSRKVIGERGTTAVEFVNHLGASAAFGVAYQAVRERVPRRVGPVALGAAYGTLLYLVNIAGLAPLLGITRGEVAAGPRKATERWGVHVLQSVVTALVAERLAPRRRRA